jgi:excinuclease UvrABC helicase subunit UvrB
MNRKIGCTVTGLLLAVALTVRANSTNAPATAEDVKRETKEALEATKDYTAQQVKEFNKKAEAKFRKLGKKLDELKAKADKRTGQSRADLDKKIAEAQKRADELKPKLEELKAATSNAWFEVKTALDHDLKELEKALK